MNRLDLLPRIGNDLVDIPAHERDLYGDCQSLVVRERYTIQIHDYAGNHDLSRERLTGELAAAM